MACVSTRKGSRFIEVPAVVPPRMATSLPVDTCLYAPVTVAVRFAVANLAVPELVSAESVEVPFMVQMLVESRARLSVPTAPVLK